MYIIKYNIIFNNIGKLTYKWNVFKINVYTFTYTQLEMERYKIRLPFEKLLIII